jgi:alkylation response protein AidB-like acyl-CoA dehydrogenase
MTYFQQPRPTLGNQFDDDRVLRSYLARVLPPNVHDAIRDELRTMGDLSANQLYQMHLDDLLEEPSFTPWSAWGERIDEIKVTAVWEEAERIAAEHGVVATAYEQAHGRWSRMHQFALAYLFIPSTDIYGCPLAMTDGAARTLLDSSNETLIDRAVPHLTSRDPDQFWTSGQWMTELAGGSDVGRSRTTARQDADGTWRLTGRKWFTSAITANMALALARPDGNPEGGKGLALFYVPIRTSDGAIRDGIRVNRLKDKLGTRKLPTAELDLDGAEAIPVGELRHGTRAITPMLNITRTWNAITALALMRRGIALARDYARKREAFGKPLAEQPLHADTLAELQTTFEGAFHLSFRLTELLGQHETAGLDDTGRALLRLLTPIAKLTTGKQVVEVTSEVVEAFGGAGYVEDTGIPVLLRDTQVLPIWEGTTNVLSLDVLRALKRTGGLGPIHAEIQRCGDAVSAVDLPNVVQVAQRAVDRADRWLQEAMAQGPSTVQAGARRFALTLGHALELALLARHAQWSYEHEQDSRALAAAERLATHRIDHIAMRSEDAAFALANDEAMPTMSAESAL